MRDFKNRQKVVVKSFEATVTNPWESRTSCVQVIDSDGNYHYVFNNQIEKVAPYTDGESYMDAGGDILIFRATGYENGPAWENTASGYVHDYDYAERPVRTLGTVVEEN